MPTSTDESYLFCQKLARRTARNFYYSFFGLPAEPFRGMCALYACMRISDDLGDDESLPLETRLNQLAEWETLLRDTLASGALNHPATASSESRGDEEHGSGSLADGRRILPALCDTATRFRIPAQTLLTVIDGVRSDLQSGPANETLCCRFRTFEELRAYCFQVAGVVGQCCLHIWGFKEARALELAIDCGLAFQLTNILRDLGEDADASRLYLPQEDLDRFGLTPRDLQQRCRDDRFLMLMQFEVDRCREYYDKAAGLFPLIEPHGRPILSAMLQIYGGLLTAIKRRHFDVYSRRISLPRWKKLLIAGRAVLQQWMIR